MHYAEFGDDEVSNFVRLTVGTDWIATCTDDRTERDLATGYQRLREQQMEGHWIESRQASEGESSRAALSLYG